MARAILLGLLALVALLPGSSSSADKELLGKLKNADARAAIFTYDRAVARAQEEFDKQAAVARKQLLADLDQAQAQATKNNKLDDALLIRDIRKTYETGRGVTAQPKVQPQPQAQLEIVSAFYGQNLNWLDVTEKVREATKGKTKWSTKVTTADWGDPAPGWVGPRTLIVRYTVAGKPGYKFNYEQKDLAIP